MNNAIRAAVVDRLNEKHMSRADLARAVGKTPQEISRALNGRKDGGSVPPLWSAMLQALDLRLTVEPDRGMEQASEEGGGQP